LGRLRRMTAGRWIGRAAPARRRDGLGRSRSLAGVARARRPPPPNPPALRAPSLRHAARAVVRAHCGGGGVRRGRGPSPPPVRPGPGRRLRGRRAGGARSRRLAASRSPKEEPHSGLRSVLSVEGRGRSPSNTPGAPRAWRRWWGLGRIGREERAWLQHDEDSSWSRRRLTTWRASRASGQPGVTVAAVARVRPLLRCFAYRAAATVAAATVVAA
jgi:hypothetical protein